MTEWTDPRYEDVVALLRWEQTAQAPSWQGPVAVRGFVVAEPEEG